MPVKKNAASALLLLVTAMILFSYYFYVAISQGRGGDLQLRISEAQYFLHGINPYDVFTGQDDVIPKFGFPNVYSFVSYLFAAPFTLFETNQARLITYILCDLAAFTSVALVLIKERLFDARAFAITLVVLMISVFFWQHVVTLNYNIIVASALFVALWAARTSRWTTFLCSGFVVGLKPTAFIPFLLLLLLRRRWRHAIAICTVQGSALGLVCLHLGISPLVYVADITQTASVWTSMSNSGVLSWIVYFGLEPSMLLSVGCSVLIVALFCFYNRSTMIGDFFLIVFVSLCFFYNNVHAWVMVFPLLAALLALRMDGEHTSAVITLMVLFLIIPKAQSLYPAQLENEILLLHNTLRFGALGWILIMTFGILAARNQENGVQPDAPNSATGSNRNHLSDLI